MKIQQKKEVFHFRFSFEFHLKFSFAFKISRFKGLFVNNNGMFLNSIQYNGGMVDVRGIV